MSTYVLLYITIPFHLISYRVSFNLVSGGAILPGQGATRCYTDGRCQCVVDATQTSAGNLIVDDVSCPLTRVESSGPACLSGASPTVSLL